MLVLIADDLPDVCNEILQNAGVEVLKKTGLKPPELDAVIKMCDGVIVRSNTKLTAPVLEKSEKLKAICRAGVGVDNIDVPAATKKGIVVMNTPAGNIISTAEHTIALLCSLSRFVPQACASVKEGKWEKKKFTGQQLTGKTFGIIGLGRVGRQVAKRAAALEMKVIGYDPFITTEISSQYNIHIVKNLRDLLAQADYITIHVTLNKETKNLITSKEFSLMKKGVQIINCARGGVICEEDLYNAIKTGQVAGAALDVFEEEPPKDNKLLQLEEVIATPHLGASTEEAQYAVAIEAAEQMAAALTGKGYKNAVNLSPYSPEEYASLKSYLALAEKMGSFLTQINNAGIQTLDIVYTGEISHKNIRIVTDSLIVGLLKPSLEEGVKVANLFIGNGALATEVGKDNKITKTYSADPSQVVFEGKAAIVANINTAGAAEAVVAAFADHKRGAIVGERTFGAGSDQKFFPLSAGGGLLLTVAKWASPSGVPFFGDDRNSLGIKPSIEVKRGDTQNPEDVDTLLDKAAPTDPGQQVAPTPTPTPKPVIHEDIQLKKAIEVLNSAA